MPHDVIMPALGVAQDSGLIITWLKQSGDAIKVGDPLMEIETDKAVMEVEAQANGYLTSVSAAEGEQVPVGKVVAVIVESEVIDNDAKPNNHEPTTQAAATPDNLPDGAHIIMPALGMAQDNGLIVAWHKLPGDSVEATDILLEVETDKSVMDVEAGHDGYIAAILADAQQSVPVGSTIAIISTSKPEKVFSLNVADTVNNPVAPVSVASSSAASITETANVVENNGSKIVLDMNRPGGQILASPKARRLAREQGLDLEQLATLGVPQPYHVADLETLRGHDISTQRSDTTTHPPSAKTESPATLLRIDARVPAKKHNEFRNWMVKHKDLCVPSRMAWLRYATAALRQAGSHHSEPLIIEVRRLHNIDGCYADADWSRMSKPVKELANQTPDLILLDFSASPITSISTTAHQAPVLTIRQEHNDYVISLDYRIEQLEERVAVDFTLDFAARLAEPLHHLL